MARTKAKNIFCLEGDWEGDLRSRANMAPILHLLEHSLSPGVKHIRRDIGTAAELEYYLDKWTQRRYVRYPILYLGFHGGPGKLYVGDGRSRALPLEWVAERLAGKCQDRVIHFGSCGTVRLPKKRLRQFLEQTGAVAVCGYEASVEWMPAAAFEIILLSLIQHYPMTSQGMAELEQELRKEASGLARALRFRIIEA